jgi:riboflavin-specific deaminase-like protein
VSSERPIAGIDADVAWSLLLALRHRRTARFSAVPHATISETDNRLVATDPSSHHDLLVIEPDGAWHSDVEVSEEAAALFALYASLCPTAPERGMTIAHLGQSLDGFIATAAGHSHYVNSNENLRHLHRLRALADAVIVGAETIALDDPQLTVRHAEGPSPTRVVLDPTCRLESDRRVFTDNGPPSVIVCATGARKPVSDATFIEIDTDEREISPADVVAALHAHDLHLLLVEGGGITVSRFLQAGALDRLQVAVAPLLIGAGRPGITVPPASTLDVAQHLNARCVTMGPDVLFDCDLRAAPPSPSDRHP